MKDYRNMLHLPHHVSAKHPPMPIEDRAAQFAPFAALTGYDEEIKEATRRVQQKISLNEDQLAELNEVLQQLKTEAHHPALEVEYFVPDESKVGGAYVTYCGTLRHLDDYGLLLYFTDGKIVPIDNILKIRIISF